MSQITVAKKRENEKLTFLLDGRADSSTAEQLREEMLNDLDGVTNIEVDCEKLSYISSSGLRIILILFKRITAAGDTLVITKPTRKVMEVLKITGLIEIFPIKDNIA